MSNFVACILCQYDCKYLQRKECDLFKEATPIDVYNKEIKLQNRNLHKICKKHSLKYYTLLDMLKGKMDMTYKYRIILEIELYEKDEYVRYLGESE